MSESPEVSQRSGTHQSGTEWLERLAQGDRPFASAVERVVRDLRDVAAAAGEEAVGELLAATARLDGEESQAGILSALLEEGRRFASRTAFFLTRPGEVRGWASCGFSGGTAPIEQVRFDYGEGGVWARLEATGGVVMLDREGCGAVCRGLDAPTGSQGVLIPFILRGERGGALYADRLNGEESLGVASLQLLTHSAAQTIETAPVRGGKRSPTLRAGAAAVSPPRPATGAAATGAAAAAIAAGAAAMGVAAVTEAAEAPAVAVEEPELEAAEEVAEIAEEIAEEAAEEAAEEVAEIAEEAAEEVAEAAEEVAEAAEEVAEAAEEAAVEEAEAVDFEMVSEAETEEAAPPEAHELSVEDLEAAEDIPAELEPEPELEDTGGIWADEEALGEEDDEPTEVGLAPDEDLAAPAPPPAVGQETVRLDVAALQRGGRLAEPAPPADAASGLPQWDVEPAPEPPDFAPEPDEPVTEVVSEVSEDATVVTPRHRYERHGFDRGYEPPAPVEEAPSTQVTPPADFTPRVEAKPPPPARPDAAGTTQVVPPTDIQGPGSAFAASGRVPDGEEALHEEARRLARLLVSEIKLYNEEIIEEGRRAGNIYERLKDDIDRSRQMYEERIDPRLLESGTDYFRQELVQRLAGGDDRLLGY